MIRTKARVVEPQQPMLVLTSAQELGAPPQARPILTSAQQPAATPQILFVVMRSVESDGNGSLVWSLCVWRVTLVNSVQNARQAGITAKSI